MLSVVLVLSVPSVTAFAETSTTSEDAAKQSVVSYLHAIDDQNADELIELVEDSRFSSLSDQKEQYENLFKDDIFSDYTLVDFENNGDGYEATINMIRKETGEVNSLTVPVEKRGDEWKLIVDGQETMSQNVKNKLQSISDSNNEVQEKSSEIAPLATSVAYWNFTFTKNGEVLGNTSTYSDTFNMTGGSVTINSWQELPGSLTSVTLLYQIVKKGFLSDDVYGETTITGRYPKNGTWYSKSIRNVETNTPPSGVCIKVYNPSSTNGPSGAGNAYQ